MAISEPGPLAAEPNRIPFAVTFGRSSFLGRSLGAALVSLGHWTVRVADPSPSPAVRSTNQISGRSKSRKGEPRNSGGARSLGIEVHYILPARFTSWSTSRTGPRSSPPSPAPLSSSTSIPSPPPPPPPPLSPPPPPNFSELHALAIGATRTLISAAIECGVRRVVSAAVAFDGSRDVVLGDDSVPYSDKYEDVLNELRAQAEMMVLDANRRGWYMYVSVGECRNEAPITRIPGFESIEGQCEPQEALQGSKALRYRAMECIE
ncbi:hypothetical protein ACMD2_18183 [Ananas comosus]|uniref:3-beta hydroxysteroid dehydrogenase/isomerase domain-containing protein n=1 Tax=Ananas comosus TaxID=4615 RepID=A0A199UT97_ANACO|nr:hypothetical protein ACMD2_18183 [Ananas comosus]